MKIRDTRHEAADKVCHTRPGMVVEFQLGHENVIAMVVATAEIDKELGSSGLYNADKNTVFAVNLKTGVLFKLPHLSARCAVPLRNATLYI